MSYKISASSSYLAQHLRIAKLLRPLLVLLLAFLASTQAQNTTYFASASYSQDIKFTREAFDVLNVTIFNQSKIQIFERIYTNYSDATRANADNPISVSSATTHNVASQISTTCTVVDTQLNFQSSSVRVFFRMMFRSELVDVSQEPTKLKLDVISSIEEGTAVPTMRAAGIGDVVNVGILMDGSDAPTAPTPPPAPVGPPSSSTGFSFVKYRQAFMLNTLRTMETKHIQLLENMYRFRAIFVVVSPNSTSPRCEIVQQAIFDGSRLDDRRRRKLQSVSNITLELDFVMRYDPDNINGSFPELYQESLNGNLAQLLVDAIRATNFVAFAQALPVEQIGYLSPTSPTPAGAAPFPTAAVAPVPVNGGSVLVQTSSAPVSPPVNSSGSRRNLVGMLSSMALSFAAIVVGSLIN